MQRPTSEPGGSAKSFSVSSAVAIPVKNEMVKAEPVKPESVKSEPKSRTATNSGNLSQRYPIFAAGVKKSGSAKSESVKAKSESGRGSASQRAGTMALPVGNEPYEGPSLGGSTTSSARRRRDDIPTPTELRTPFGPKQSFHLGPVKPGSLPGSRAPSVVSVRSSTRSGR